MAHNGLLPDVALDGLNSHDELVDEAKTPVGCCSNCKSGSQDSHTEEGLKEEKGEENEEAVEGSRPNLK